MISKPALMKLKTKYLRNTRRINSIMKRISLVVFYYIGERRCLYFWKQFSIRHHFLLVERDSFEILNMEKLVDQNMLKLIDFFNRNKQYRKEDILIYIAVSNNYKIGL